jgi:perosamine synthetase
LPIFEKSNVNPIAASIPERAINLPSYHDMTTVEQDMVISPLLNIVKGIVKCK